MKKEVIAGMIESAIVTSVIMLLMLMALGLEAFVALIPAILLFATGVAGVVLGFTLIFYRKVVKFLNESPYTTFPYKKFICQYFRKSRNRVE